MGVGVSAPVWTVGEESAVDVSQQKLKRLEIIPADVCCAKVTKLNASHNRCDMYKE
jgi:hypothetical protein